MPTIDEMYADLESADAAGDYELANVIASKIKQAQKSKPLPMKMQPALPTPTQAAVAGGVRGIGNLLAGAILRGPGSIGSTILTPADMAIDYMRGTEGSNQRRREAIDAGLMSLFGADPESASYQIGKIGAEVGGTLGVGGAIARALPAAAPLAESVATGGFRAGGMTGKGGMAVRTIGGAISGGATAGLVDPDQALTGAAIGGAIPGAATLAGKTGSVIGSGARKVIGGKISDEARDLAIKAKQKYGIDIPADRIASSKPLNAAASSLGYIPFSGRAAVEERMGKQFERAVSRTIGQDTDNLSHAISNARDELGAVFDDTLKNNKVVFDGQFASDLDDVIATADRTLGDDGLRVITKQVEAIKKKASSGEIDGDAAYDIKKELDRIIKANSGRELGIATSDLKDSLLSALNRSIGPDKADAFRVARKQYGNMLDLEKIALRNSEEGGLSVARFANNKYRDPELKELAKIGRRFIKEREAPHGSAQRVVLGTGAAGIGGAGAIAGMPAMVGAGAALAGGAALGRTANAALNSSLLKDFLLQQPNQQSGILSLLMQEAAHRTAPVAVTSLAR